MKIKMKLQPGLYDPATVDEFKKLCQEHSVDLEIYNRENEIQNSVLDFVMVIALSPDFRNLVQGWISSGFYDYMKYQIVKLVRGTASSKHMGSIKIKAGEAEIHIQNENLSDEVIEKALDTFARVVTERDISKLSPREKMLNTPIVFCDPETGKVAVLSEFDYVKKYYAKPKNDAEETNGQTENAHAE